jgi:hypothetical protein
MRYLLISTFLLLSLTCTAQTVLVSLEPALIQPGLMYHQQISERIGLYVKGRYGNLTFDDFKCNYLKTSVGATLFDTYEVHWMAGITYSKFYNVVDYSPFIDLSLIHDISVEAGIMLEWNDRLRCTMMFDPLNWEVELGLGFKLYRDKQPLTYYKYSRILRY